MFKLDVSARHQLTQEEAQKRIKRLLNDFQVQFPERVIPRLSVSESWAGNVDTFNFSVLGGPASGTLTVGERDVTIEGDLPEVAAVYKGKIGTTLYERAIALLA